MLKLLVQVLRAPNAVSCLISFSILSENVAQFVKQYLPVIYIVAFANQILSPDDAF